MVRCAPLSCLVLAAALTACGGGGKIAVGYPDQGVPANIKIPDPVAWDGTAPAPGTVTFISVSPNDKSKFIAYEVDPKAHTVVRTIEDQIDTLQKLVIVVVSDPKSNAGTLNVILRPPPPPPDGQDLVNRAIQVDNAANGEPRRPEQHRSPDR